MLKSKNIPCLLQRSILTQLPLVHLLDETKEVTEMCIAQSFFTFSEELLSFVLRRNGRRLTWCSFGANGLSRNVFFLTLHLGTTTATIH